MFNIKYNNQKYIKYYISRKKYYILVSPGTIFTNTQSVFKVHHKAIFYSNGIIPDIFFKQILYNSDL